MKRKNLDGFSSPDLSEKQKQIVEMCLQGQNVFITGGAGVGKTVTSLAVIEALRSSGKKVAVAASTGIAATLLAGTTLHSLFSIPPKRSSVIKHSAVWETLDALIIDEVSMVDVPTWVFLFKQASVSRSVPKPFGGVQIIAVGDFLQLPPVELHTDKRDRVYLFENKFWKQTFPPGTCVELTDVYRQEDLHFIKILNRIRLGLGTKQDIDWLTENTSREKPRDTVVHVFATNERVNKHNTQQLLNYPGVTHVFAAGVVWAKAMTKEEKIYWGSKLKRSENIPDRVLLRKGLPVMLTDNLDVTRGLVNGTRGVISDFPKPHSAPLVTFFIHGKPVACHIFTRVLNRQILIGTGMTTGQVTYIPLSPASALTVHKSQGQSFDQLAVDLDGMHFTPGHGYTSISRVRSPRNLYLSSASVGSFLACPRTVEWYMRLFPLKSR